MTQGRGRGASRRGRARPSTLSAASRALAAGVALAAFATGALLAARYPIAPGWVLTAYVMWVAAVGARRSLWIGVLPAILPVVGFASWSGWLIFEEWDLLALGAAAGGYASLAWRPPADTGSANVSREQGGIVIALFAVSALVSLVRGIDDAGPLAWDLWQQYYDPLNTIRALKGLAFALLLLPLLRADLRERGARSVDALAVGLAAGCAAASLVVLWERVAFPGALDFSTDYRATGPFWEMHVGGAALDAFLVLTFPFAVWHLLHRRRRIAFAVAGVMAMLGAYALLATFSRGVYLALPVAAAVLAVSLIQRRAVTPRQRLGLLAKGLLLVVGTASVAFVVFRSGGYRALGAVLGVLALALPLAEVIPRPRARDALAGVACGALLSLCGWIAATLLPAGPYVAFAGAWLACAAWLARPDGDGRARRPAVALALLVCLVAMAALIAYHWGGTPALGDASIALLAVVVLAAAGARQGESLSGWRWKEHAGALGAAALVAATVTVFSGGGYMLGRFATGEEDLSGRLRHWHDGLALLDGPVDWLFGNGLGRFPSHYLTHAGDDTFPGTLRLDRSGDDAFLVLAGPRYRTNFADLFRVSQRVRPVPGRYLASIDVRAAQATRLHVEICEKHLLYAGACAIGGVDVPVSSAWERRTVALDGGDLGQGPWYAPRLAFFSIAVESSSRVVDIDNIALTAPDGRDILANGDFSAGMARWFFTSDRQHLPWHHKNLWLGVLIDQGGLGLLAFLALCAVAWWRVALGAARRHPLAPFFAAALAGAFVVGAFDTLLDAPRVAFVFYLVAFAGLALPYADSQSKSSAPS